MNNFDHLNTYKTRAKGINMSENHQNMKKITTLDQYFGLTKEEYASMLEMAGIAGVPEAENPIQTFKRIYARLSYIFFEASHKKDSAKASLVKNFLDKLGTANQAIVESFLNIENKPENKLEDNTENRGDESPTETAALFLFVIREQGKLFKDIETKIRFLEKIVELIKTPQSTSINGVVSKYILLNAEKLLLHFKSKIVNKTENKIEKESVLFTSFIRWDGKGDLGNFVSIASPSVLSEIPCLQTF